MKGWYHGSPSEITELRTGSTITKHYDLACIFSHKPPIVSINADGIIKHNGREIGLLYLVDEPIDVMDDIEPHPRSTMGDDMEWITKRALKLKLIKEIGPPKIADVLTEDEINELRKMKT